jgi:hypothetical protein
MVESIRCGYRQNRYELEAREFAAANLDQYRGFLREIAGGDGFRGVPQEI